MKPFSILVLCSLWTLAPDSTIGQTNYTFSPLAAGYLPASDYWLAVDGAGNVFANEWNTFDPTNGINLAIQRVAPTNTLVANVAACRGACYSWLGLACGGTGDLYALKYNLFAAAPIRHPLYSTTHRMLRELTGPRLACRSRTGAATQ